VKTGAYTVTVEGGEPFVIRAMGYADAANKAASRLHGFSYGLRLTSTPNQPGWFRAFVPAGQRGDRNEGPVGDRFFITRSGS
jgi:hypothetical protein